MKKCYICGRETKWWNPLTWLDGVLDACEYCKYGIRMGFKIEEIRELNNL